MALSNPATARSRVLGALAVLVLGLLISLALFVGRGGCTSAVAFDRPAEGEPQPARLGAARVVEAPTAPRGESAPDAERRAKRGAAAVARGPVRGIVVDAATHEIVPYVEVELALGVYFEKIQVGEDGRFASASDLPSGEVRAVVRDEGVEVGGAKIVHDAARGTTDWRVEVPIGPTIPIAGIDDRPIRADAWRARIVESALAPEIVGEIDVVESGLALHAPSAARPDREWSWRELRPGNRRWIRYPRREYAPIDGVAPELEMRDDIANREGFAPLRKTDGVHPAVAVESRAFGRARVRIARTGEKKSPMRAVLYDTRDLPLDSGPGAPVFDELEVGRDGMVEFADLEGGTKHLVAWSTDEHVDAHFVVVEGPSEVIEVASRRVDREVRPAPELWRMVQLNCDWTHVIARPSVAQGRMRAAIVSGWNHYVMEALIGRALSTGVDGLDLRTVFARYPDTNENCAYRFDVAGESKPLGVELAFGPGGELFPSETWRTGHVLDLPKRIELAWSAWAKGMQPVFGTYAANEDREEELVAHIAFEAGFGAQIVLRAGDPAQKPLEFASGEREKRVRQRRQEPQSVQDERIAAVLAAPPVPGIAMEIDGSPSGRSDAGGELRIRQRFTPARLTLVGRGWRLTALEKLPGNAPRYVAWLRRNP